MKSDDCIVVTGIVSVDPAAAFRLFTEEIGSWWRPKVKDLFHQGEAGVMKFEPGPGGRLLEIYPGTAEAPFEVGAVRVWEPGRRIVFGWRQKEFAPTESTEVEVRFEAHPRGARIIITHSGWGVLPADHAARFGFTGEAFTALMGLRWADVFTAFRVLVNTSA